MDGVQAAEIAKDYFQSIEKKSDFNVIIEAVIPVENLWQVIISYYEIPPTDFLPPKKIYKQIDVDIETKKALSMKFLNLEMNKAAL